MWEGCTKYYTSYSSRNEGCTVVLTPSVPSPPTEASFDLSLAYMILFCVPFKEHVLQDPVNHSKYSHDSAAHPQATPGFSTLYTEKLEVAWGLGYETIMH